MVHTREAFRGRATRRRLIAAGGVLAGALALTGLPGVASAGPNVSARKVTAAKDIAALRAEVRNGTLGRSHGSVNGCRARHLGCRASVVTTSRTSATPLTTATPVGWGATELQKAFRLTHAANGTGMITIIGVGAYPNLESDLRIYRAQYGLAACTIRNDCLKIADYKGGPALEPSDPADEENIGVETALDVQMASAACPTCKITYLGVPITFDNNGFIRGFATAVKTAVRMHTASVSISYGFDTTKAIDTGPSSQALLQPGTALFSAAGDFGYMDPATFQTGIGGWPQNLRSVVSTGGTTMTASSTSATGFSQTAWDGAGSGCAPDLAAAYGQPASVAKDCKGHRAVSDVAAVADNVAVYDSYAPSSGEPFGWISVGGTSASSPFLAGMAARAPRVSDAIGPNVIYRAPAGAFTDITTGTNGLPAQCTKDGVSPVLCKAAPGWDGATGRGIPNGLAPFTSGPS
jgi:hypothetical protein